jgi:hypothetical protein
MRSLLLVCAALASAVLAGPAAAQSYSDFTPKPRPVQGTITSPATSQGARLSVEPATDRDLVTRPLIGRFRGAPLATRFESLPVVLRTTWLHDRYNSPGWWSTRRYTPTSFRYWKMDDPPIAGYPIGDR